MTRAELKKHLGTYRPSLIRPEMFANLSERKLMRTEERIYMRCEREKLVIYKNKSLTDEQRYAGWRKACDRRTTAIEKLRPLRFQCDRMHERRMIKMLAWGKTRSNASSGHRAVA